VGKASLHTKMTMCLLVVGNLIGAGILAMPVEIGIAGMIPSVIALFFIGGMMLMTSIILSREACDSKDDLFNYPSLYGKYFGSFGKWLAVGANILILYGMMVAYLSGAAVAAVQIYHGPGGESVCLIAFFLILTCVMLGGRLFVHHINALMVVMMWGAFVIILAVTEKHVQFERMKNCDWNFFPFALPVVLTAFWFHNIIPNVCRNLKWDRKAILQVLICAVGIGSIMYLLWTFVAVGAIPLSGAKDSLAEAYKLNLPATIPLENISHSVIFKTFALSFALLALSSSYISTALGTRSFNEDLFRQFKFNAPPALIMFATLAPAFIIAILFKDVFIKAVNLVGGLGIAILYGILPCILALIRSKGDGKYLAKIFSVLALLAFIALALWQALVEFSILTPVIP
jgi:tyrosine-specific transport protein